jgi:hypothetical protein
MFSTTTMASSTRMPIEKISANSDTRLSVKPQAQLANSVAVSVRITAAPTITASRRPSARPTSRITDAGGEGQLLDQLVGLFGRRLAVVAGDRGLDAGGITVLRSSSSRARAARATSTAFWPGFLVTVSVRAGNTGALSAGSAAGAAAAVPVPRARA